ncbi:MAG: PDZ domain-containing protein, partial [Lachnospiraceae bacterium]|nr:PDZ domain-containing protein [Lachnospiraceae bacterium]
MSLKGHRIRSVEPDSIAWEMGVEPGMYLVSVNGHPLEDVFDYRYFMAEEEVQVLIREESGEETLLEIEKDAEEDFGVEFESSLMDDYRSCSNRCIFCFIDQMPPGMRQTLYFKDDDSRLSFLQGNYVTLTNMSDRDIERIIRYRLEPINISVHTTNPALRVRMLHNRFAGDVFPKIAALRDAHIVMNGQIVLCRGFNDGAELDRTVSDLMEYLPEMQSVSV